MSPHSGARLVFLGLVALTLAFASSAWTRSDAIAQGRSSSLKLRLPDTPYRYAQIDLPPHFRTNTALRLDNTPTDNPISDHGATLGRVLFYDMQLSANNTTSCGSCHLQEHSFVDPNQFSKGFEGKFTDRHAMNLVDLRYYGRGRFFWDERGGNLEDMVLLPVQNRIEMGEDLARVPRKLAAIDPYPELFRRAFGDSEITERRMAMALAQFIRSMVSYQSRYDEGRAKVTSSFDDFDNFTVQENRGKALFMRHCSTSCHLPFQDAHFFMLNPTNNGLDDNARETDGGVGEITLRAGDLGHFKAPSLRNIEVAAPYMHDGRFATLEAVIDHYSRDFKAHPNLDFRMRPLNFTESEKAALLAFLRTLTDRKFLTDPKFSDPFK